MYLPFFIKSGVTYWQQQKKLGYYIIYNYKLLFYEWKFSVICKWKFLAVFKCTA
jgi:hypothetical protein